MFNKYVSAVSPADFEFAVWLMDLVDGYDEYMFDECGSAGYDLMKFIYGDGM